MQCLCFPLCVSPYIYSSTIFSAHVSISPHSCRGSVSCFSNPTPSTNLCFRRGFLASFCVLWRKYTKIATLLAAGMSSLWAFAISETSFPMGLRYLRHTRLWVVILMYYTISQQTSVVPHCIFSVVGGNAKPLHGNYKWIVCNRTIYRRNWCIRPYKLSRPYLRIRRWWTFVGCDPGKVLWIGRYSNGKANTEYRYIQLYRA